MKTESTRNWKFAYTGSNRIEAFELLAETRDVSGAPRAILAGIINCLDKGLILKVEASGEIVYERAIGDGTKATINYEIRRISLI